MKAQNQITLKALFLGILVFLLFLYPKSSLADILFLDLNNNPKEIEAAQKAAAKRREKLIVLPQITNERKIEIKKLENELKKARNQYATLCNQITEACQRATATLSAATTKYNESRKVLNKEFLSQELRQLHRQEVNLTSVVISGHDGNGSFDGVFGDLNDADIKEAFDSVSPFGESIRSLLLWGCYTTNIGSLETNWKKILPNLNVIAGFDDSAPLGDKPANWDLLEDILVKEKTLTDARDQKALMHAFNSLRSANKTHAAICVNEDSYASPRGVISIKAELEKCKDLRSGELIERFQCYEKAQKGCEDVPADTQSGPLRSIYTELQKTKHCKKYIPANLTVPDPDVTLRLVHDKNVRTNFEYLHSDGMNQINSLMKELNFSDSLQLKNIGKMKRKDFLDQISAIQKEIDNRTNAIKDDEGRIDDPLLLGLKNAIGPVRQLSQISQYDHCIPFGWVHENATEKSSCPWKETMHSAREVGQFTALETRADREDEKTEDKLLGSQYAELVKKEAEARKTLASLNEKQNSNNEKEALTKEIEKYKLEAAIIKYQNYAQYSQNRVQFYQEKINSIKDPNSLEKRVYQKQLKDWQDNLKEAKDKGNFSASSQQSPAPGQSLPGLNLQTSPPAMSVAPGTPR